MFDNCSLDPNQTFHQFSLCLPSTFSGVLHDIKVALKMLRFRYSRHVLRIESFLHKSCISLFRLIYSKLAQNSSSQIRFIGIHLSCILSEVKRCKMFPYSVVFFHHDLIIVLILIGHSLLSRTMTITDKFSRHRCV